MSVLSSFFDSVVVVVASEEENLPIDEKDKGDDIRVDVVWMTFP